MDDLVLIVEGIQNKIKKLSARNIMLQEQVASLQAGKDRLQSELDASLERVRRLEEELTQMQFARMADGVDSSRAKQKIDELLRDIEKTTVLLNK